VVDDARPLGTTLTKGPPISDDHTDQRPPDPAEIVSFLEAHLADLNANVAFNTAALAALGADTIAVSFPDPYEPNSDL